MRTNMLLLLAVLALAAPAAAQEIDAQATVAPRSLGDHFSVGAGLEVDLVGLAYGVRPEVLFRPVADGGAHIRLAVGALAGPELWFMPVALGYRHLWSKGRKIRPHLGGGVELQTFWFGGGSPVSRAAFYAETGFEFEVFKGGWVGLQYGPDFAPFSHFGFGFVARTTFRYDL